MLETARLLARHADWRSWRSGALHHWHDAGRPAAPPLPRSPAPQVSFCFVGQPLAMMLYYHDWRQGYTHPLAGLPVDALAAIRGAASL